jgi:hypothetical protein
MEGRTTFMVAHRLSTIHQADLTLVMNHGEVVEQGTHEELIARDGLYNQLHDAQHGTRRRAAAAISPDGLSEMTRAITEARASGRGPSGPAMAELAKAMAAGGNGTRAAAWQLIGAAWPLLQDGSPEPLRELAARHDSTLDEAPRMAQRLLSDLGLTNGNGVP